MSNIEMFVNLQISILECKEFEDISNECRKKYNDSKLYFQCIKKKLGKRFNINTKTMSKV